MSSEDATLLLDGYSLTPSELYQLSFGKTQIALTEEARGRVNAGRAVVDAIVASGEVVYGINTGTRRDACAQLSMLYFKIK